MGCYDDSEYVRDLDEDYYYFGYDNSVSECTNYCSERGRLQHCLVLN